MPLTAENALFGHTSPATAYLVSDYPYGRRIRCRIRYWIETVPRRGDRFVSQTENPNTLVWNAPKRSTYVPVGIMFLDEKGHVAWDALSSWSSARAIEAFREAGGDNLTPLQAEAVRMVAALHKVNARMEAARLAS